MTVTVVDFKNADYIAQTHVFTAALLCRHQKIVTLLKNLKYIAIISVLKECSRTDNLKLVINEYMCIMVYACATSVYEQTIARVSLYCVIYSVTSCIQTD